MDRQSEAYRWMAEDDILENLPDSVYHVAAISLEGIILPDGYLRNDYRHYFEGPKNYAQAEIALYGRIVDLSAPDDISVEGVYLRWAAEHKRGKR